MRPGARKLFERLGYRYWGRTPLDEEVWAVEFDAQTRSLPRPAEWRRALKQLLHCQEPCQEPCQDSSLEFKVISWSP